MKFILLLCFICVFQNAFSELDEQFVNDVLSKSGKIPASSLLADEYIFGIEDDNYMKVLVIKKDDISTIGVTTMFYKTVPKEIFVASTSSEPRYFANGLEYNGDSYYHYKFVDAYVMTTKVKINDFNWVQINSDEEFELITETSKILVRFLKENEVIVREFGLKDGKMVLINITNLNRLNADGAPYGTPIASTSRLHQRKFLRCKFTKNTFKVKNTYIRGYREQVSYFINGYDEYEREIFLGHFSSNNIALDNGNALEQLDKYISDQTCPDSTSKIPELK